MSVNTDHIGILWIFLLRLLHKYKQITYRPVRKPERLQLYIIFWNYSVLNCIMRWWAQRCTLFNKNPYLEEYRGRILGRNPDKSLQSFPPCYSQSPLQLCFEFYSYFFKLTQPLTVATVQLLYTVKKTGGKPDRKPYSIPNG